MPRTAACALVLTLLAACGPSATETPAAAPQPFMQPQTPIHLPATEEPTARPTEVPTDEPTAVPATATSKPVPTKAQPTMAPPTVPPPTLPPPPPTEAPPAPQPLMQAPEPASPRADLDPSGDLDCKDFGSQAEAQAYWDYWHARGVPNPGRLDGNDKDGKVCESWR